MPTDEPRPVQTSGAGPAPDPPEADSARIELSEYQGDYRNVELESTYSLTPLGDALPATHTRLGHHLLEAVGPDHFRSGVFGEVRFQRDSRGRITGFIADQPHNTGIPFHRTDS